MSSTSSASQTEVSVGAKAKRLIGAAWSRICTPTKKTWADLSDCGEGVPAGLGVGELSNAYPRNRLQKNFKGRWLGAGKHVLEDTYTTHCRMQQTYITKPAYLHMASKILVEIRLGDTLQASWSLLPHSISLAWVLRPFIC